VALKGLDAAEQKQILRLLQTVEDNVAADWEYVKKGNKRKY
jgi:hypothetical protein